ncbi:MAG: MBL fold metallo-hydrolase, partial [Pseudomonadota bacterium]
AALILGDAIANHHVALARPDWIAGSDQDGARGAATRLRLLDRIMAEDLRVVGFHMPGGGLGRIDRSESGYLFVPGAT